MFELTSLSPPSRDPDRWSENSSVLSLYALCMEELSLNRWFNAGDRGRQGWKTERHYVLNGELKVPLAFMY